MDKQTIDPIPVERDTQKELAGRTTDLQKDQNRLYNVEIDQVFIETIKKIKEIDIKGPQNQETKLKPIVLAPTYYPETCSILQKIQDLGVESVIVGGNDKEPLFQGVRQVAVNFPSSGVDSETEENTKKIIEKIPLECLENRVVYLYQFMHYKWRKYLQERIKTEKINCVIAADMTQGFEALFEGKHNLPKVLQSSGLKDHIIPNEVIDSKTLTRLAGEEIDCLGLLEDDTSLLLDETREEFEEKLIELYKKFGSEGGKAVIQLCGNDYQEVGGGEGTKIVKSFAEFKDAIIKMSASSPKAEIKVSKFIQGMEGNFSFITIPSFDEQLTSVPRIVSESQNLNEMQKIAMEAGIKDSTVIAARTTLKCVGEPLLTKKSGSGVGNDLGYLHSQKTREAITEIGQKLGHFMAKCGKWGLAGCDIKIDPEGRVYIIEINNRQQGPTAQMSEDGEDRHLPSLIKMQVIYAFGSVEDVKNLHNLLGSKETEISSKYAEGAGSFYIKFATTEDSYIKQQLKPGFYKAIRAQNQKWEFDLNNPIKNTTQQTALECNKSNGFTKNEMIIELRAGSHEQNAGMPCGTQVCRIVGLSDSANGFPSPFEVKGDKKSVGLQQDWKNLISDFKEFVLSKEKTLPIVIKHESSLEYDSCDSKTSPKSRTTSISSYVQDEENTSQEVQKQKTNEELLKLAQDENVPTTKTQTHLEKYLEGIARNEPLLEQSYQ